MHRMIGATMTKVLIGVWSHNKEEALEDIKKRLPDFEVVSVETDFQSLTKWIAI